MSDDRAEEDRARRAARRRASLEGAIVRCGTPKPPLHDRASIEERVAHAWRLTRRLWLLAGRDLPDVPRNELPGEVFDIRAERRRSTG